MTQEPRPNLSVLKGEEGRGRDEELTTNGPMDELVVATRNLTDAGVSRPDEFAYLGAQTIFDTLQWFHAQDGVTAGLLVKVLRAGGKPGWAPRGSKDAGQRSREYERQIVAWLNEHFPDLTQRSGNPHPAAIVEVMHLHQQFGKGRLLPREHAARIRAAVRAFNEKWQYDPKERSSS